MIYEVEFTAASREAARAVARQLIEERVLESASITHCDVIGANAAGDIEEQYVVKVKGLTTAVKYLIENYNLKNFTAKAVILNDNKAKEVRSWCNEEDDVLVKPVHSWRELRAEILVEQARTEESEEPVEIEAHHIVSKPVTSEANIQAANEFTHHNKMGAVQAVGEVPQEIIDTANITSEYGRIPHHGTTEGAAEFVGTIAGEDEKRRQKLPRWAEEEGLTLAEYKKRCNERTAARWGITMSEYNKLAAEARKNDRPLKEYFEEQGLVYTEDLSEPEDEFDDGTEQTAKIRELRDAESSFINWLQSVDLPMETTIDAVFDSWCSKYELTQHQRAILRCTAKPRIENSDGKVPQWANKLGLSFEQYHLIRRMGTAANWGITLSLYDTYYLEAKKDGTSLDNLLAINYSKGTEKNAAHRIGSEFRAMMNHINKLQELYAESEEA